jgi:hypothetical protein
MIWLIDRLKYSPLSKKPAQNKKNLRLNISNSIVAPKKSAVITGSD